ncbi:MAG TPA: tetratricopeptide repeat protein [Bacteroidia bacterium]|jgi:tetratricopeptide (TPR) repeat protein
MLSRRTFLLPGVVLASVLLSSCFHKGMRGPKPNSEDRTAYDKRKLDYLYFEAIDAKIKGNTTEALEKFQKCLNLDPNNAAVNYEIANLLHANGKNTEALPFAKKAAGLDEQNVWYQLLLADCLRGLEKYNDAIVVYQKTIKIFPDKLDLYYELASCYLYAGKPDDAVKTYDRIEEKIGITEEISVQKERILYKMHDNTRAEEELQKLINAYPDQAEYYNLLGQLYRETGQRQKAINAYKKILELDPSNGSVHLSLADYYRDEKDDQRSFDELKQAFASPSLEVDTKMKILLQYFTFSESDSSLKVQADTLVRVFVRTHPTDAKAQSIMGDFLFRDKKYPEALDAFRKAAALDKNRFPIWNQILIIDNELDQYDSLESESSQAMELFPNEPSPYLFKGVAFIQKKKYKEAIDILNEGKEYVVDNNQLKAEFYSNLGDAWNKLKNNEESDKAFDKALELDPDNTGVLNNYAYYLSLRGEKLDKAEKMAKHVNELQENVASYEDTYGWILYREGKYEEAKKWIEMALRNGAMNRPVILEHFGDVMYRLGDTDKAYEFWNKALKAGKGSEFLEKKINDRKLYE